MPSPSNSRREEWQEGIFLALALPLIGALAFFVLGCFRLFLVPSGSMLPDYRIGSYVLVSRLETGFNGYTFDSLPLPVKKHWPDYPLRRGDVVVFRMPSDHKIFFIKRIVGLPGDIIAMQKGHLVINGKPVQRTQTAPITVSDGLGQDTSTKAYIEELPDGPSHTIIETQGDGGPLDDTQEFNVPAGNVFVMGDNRDNSNDSRMDIGMVPVELINGKVITSFRIPGG